MTKKYILAVVGMAGAGKTEAVDYLLKKTNWPKIYLGDATFDELKRQNLEINEANERAVREKIRKELGMGAYAKLNLPKIKELFKEGSVLVESLYSWEEYLEFKKEFPESFLTLAIYSSPQTRIERLKNRPKRPLSAEELVSRDYAQIENLHQAGPIARADFTIINESSLEDLHQKCDYFLNNCHLFLESSK